jgi:DNA-binding protein YbaB
VDGLDAQVSALLAEQERFAEGIRRIQAELADVRATAESDDGLIKAEVDVRGSLRTLELDPRIYRSPDSTALAADITRTVARASEQAQRRAVEISSEILPDGVNPEEADLAFDPILHQLDSARQKREQAWHR